MLYKHRSLLLVISYFIQSLCLAQNPPWADSVIVAARNFRTQPNLQTADQLATAADMMPVKNWELYLLAATVYSPNGEIDKAFTNIEKAIEAGLKDQELLETLPPFTPLKSHEKWPILLQRVVQVKEDELANLENPGLLKTLQNLWIKDQEAIQHFEKKLQEAGSEITPEEHDELFEAVTDTWLRHGEKLDSIIQLYKWPGFQLVGEEGEKLSWAVAQHHPNIFAKRRYQKLLKEAVLKNDADPNHYAELTDRIARDTWQKQTYGSSMDSDTPYPIRDEENVDQRRYALGLVDPVELYALYHDVNYKRKTQEEAEADSVQNWQQAQRSYHNFTELWDANERDSAITKLRKAISYHGDVSELQLFEAAKKLSQSEDYEAVTLSIKILKVLIWRKWLKEEQLNDDVFINLRNDKSWMAIKYLLDTLD